MRTGKKIPDASASGIRPVLSHTAACEACSLSIFIYEAIALRVGKSFITECWWKILPSVASLAVWGVHRFRMATRV